jgi:hypothetical protein
MTDGDTSTRRYILDRPTDDDDLLYMYDVHVRTFVNMTVIKDLAYYRTP